MIDDEDVLAAVGKTKSDIEDLADINPDADILSGDVEDAISEFMGTLDESEGDRHKSRIGIYHASESSCIRKRWYKFHNVVKQDWDEFPLGIGERGNRMEDWIEQALEYKFGSERVGNEYPVVHEVDSPFGEFKITGSTDPYVTDEDGNIALLTEVKSTLNISNGLPKWYHVWQLNTYLSILDMDSGVIVYISPSDYEDNTVIEVEQDDKLWNLIKFYHSLTHYYISNEKLPPKLPIDSNECERCPYKGLCVRNNDGMEYTEDTFPPRHGNSE